MKIKDIINKLFELNKNMYLKNLLTGEIFTEKDDLIEIYDGVIQCVDICESITVTFKLSKQLKDIKCEDMNCKKCPFNVLNCFNFDYARTDRTLGEIYYEIIAPFETELDNLGLKIRLMIYNRLEEYIDEQ